MNQETCRAFRKKDLADFLGVDLRTVDNRVSRFGWGKDRDADGYVTILVPESYLEKNAKHSGSHPETATKPPGKHPEGFEKLLEMVRKEYENRLKDKEEMIAVLREQNATLKDQNTLLNNQVSASNTAIQRYKQQDDDIKAIRASLEASMRKAPFWQFWKRS